MNIDPLIPPSYSCLKRILAMVDHLCEIRLRADRPMIFYIKGKEYFLTEKDKLSEASNEAVGISGSEIRDWLGYLCKDSLYAYQNELKDGYLSVPGGHRVGIVGQAVIEQGRVIGFRYITGLNIRISHEIKGVADNLLEQLFEGGELKNTLLISPPGCGKTTMLRDLIRLVSNGTNAHHGMTVCVVDERGELSGSYHGHMANDLGIRTDVMGNCPKKQAMGLLLRSMAPQVMAVDELGDKEEFEMVREAMHCGVKILATMHGDSGEDIIMKKGDFFDRYVVLFSGEGNCGIRNIWTREELPYETFGSTVDFRSNNGNWSGL